MATSQGMYFICYCLHVDCLQAALPLLLLFDLVHVMADAA